MSIEVDVRDTKSYTDEWTRNLNKDEERLIRFRVTDDHYLCYRGMLTQYQLDPENDWPDAVYGDIDYSPNLSVTINPPPPMKGRNDIDYEVRILYEKRDDEGDYSMCFATATPSKTDVLSTYLYGNQTKLFLTFELKNDTMGDERTVVIRESWYQKLQSYLLTDVTLVASDGEVGTKMELLRANSEAFDSMFALETSAEYQTKRVEIKDYSEAALKAFVHFLATHEIIDGKNTACDLLLLADKYNIPELKTRAEKMLLKNANADNVREVYQVFAKVSPELLEKLFIETHGQ